MSDEEIICTFMEPKPKLPPYWGSWPEHEWWRLVQVAGGCMEWIPILMACAEIEKLGRLHKVEAH